MSKRQLKSVFNKELRETLRDRRSLISSLLVPCFGAFLMFVMVQKAADSRNESKDVDLHVQGASYAPSLIERLERAHIKIKEAPQDPVAAIQDKSINALLTIPEDFDRQLAQGTSIPLTLKGDLSNKLSQNTVSRAEKVIAGYGAELRFYRTLARGVAMQLLTPFQLNKVDLATDEQRSSHLTMMLLIFALMSTIAGGMYVAIDASAGERERKSLEPLLSTPCPLGVIVAGKWMVATLMSCVTCLITLVLLRQALLWSPFESLGLNLSLDATQIIGVFFCLIPLGGLMSAFQLLIGTYARSFREAQTYMSFFMIVPILPSFLFEQETGRPELWMHAIPTLGQHIQSLALLRGEAVEPLHWALSVGTCLVLIPCGLIFLTRLLRDEKVIYGR